MNVCMLRSAGGSTALVLLLVAPPMLVSGAWADSALVKLHWAKRAVFSFLYLKKINFKNICPFWKISKIYPGRPMGGDRAQM